MSILNELKEFRLANSTNIKKYDKYRCDSTEYTYVYVYRYYCLDLSDVFSIATTPRCGGDNHNRHLSYII